MLLDICVFVLSSWASDVMNAAPFTISPKFASQCFVGVALVATP
jgi:hypothetical protein